MVAQGTTERAAVLRAREEGAAAVHQLTIQVCCVFYVFSSWAPRVAARRAADVASAIPVPAIDSRGRAGRSPMVGVMGLAYRRLFCAFLCK